MNALEKLATKQLLTLKLMKTAKITEREGAGIGAALGGPIGAAIGAALSKDSKDKYHGSPGWRAFGGSAAGMTPGLILSSMAARRGNVRLAGLGALLSLAGNVSGAMYGARSARRPGR